MLAFACEAHTEVTLSPPGVTATLPRPSVVFSKPAEDFYCPLLHQALAVGFDVTRIVCDPLGQTLMETLSLNALLL